jgi:hypothetical protein
MAPAGRDTFLKRFLNLPKPFIKVSLISSFLCVSSRVFAVKKKTVDLGYPGPWFTGFSASFADAVR